MKFITTILTVPPGILYQLYNDYVRYLYSIKALV